jgi:hypothetical protein
MSNVQMAGVRNEVVASVVESKTNWGAKEWRAERLNQKEMIKRTKGFHIWQNPSKTVTGPDCEERWTRRSERRVLCKAAVSWDFEVSHYDEGEA